MKKPKIKFDAAAMQSFFVRHVEKIVLGIVVLVMAWLVYQGYSLPGLEKDKTPSGLVKASTGAMTFIDDPTRWTVVSQERKGADDLTVKVGWAQRSTDPGKYVLIRPWSPPDFPKLSPRTDPKIFPPQHLVVIPQIGPIASLLKTDTELDPLEEIPAEEGTTAKKPAAKPAKLPKAKGPPGSTPYDAYGGAMSGMSENPYGAKSRRTSRSKAGSIAPGVGGPREGESSASNYGSEAYGMGGSGGYGYGAQGQGAINPESILGYSGGEIARFSRAMVIKAVVPYEKEIEEYVNSLSNSLDYEPQRDQPEYLKFWIQRAEIPADNLAADPATLAWKPLSINAALAEQFGFEDPKTRQQWPGDWAGSPTEIVDPAYLDPNLTLPAPPFTQRDLWPLLTHPDVPLAEFGANSPYGGETAPGGAVPPPTAAPSDDLPTLPGMNASGYGGPGGEGMSGMYGAGRSGMPGMGRSGMPGYGSSAGSGSGYGRGRSGYSGMGSRGMTAPGVSMGSSGRSGASYGGGTSYGSGPMGYGGEGGYGAGMAVAPPKFKLIRFTDTHVEEGKFYRYRLQVVLHDPNHPDPRIPAPTLASLDQTVRDRIKTQDAADAKTVNPMTGVAKRTFWVVSPWSEPSDVVSLPSTRQYFAGSVTRPAATTIVEGKPKIPNNQDSATVLTSVWDPVKVVDVPAEQEVYRGSVLNFVKDAQVIHPLGHMVIDMKEYKFHTDAIVADLEGGETIPPHDRKSEHPLKAPGEVLVVDDAGNLHVRDETQDIESFRRLLVPKKEAAPAATAGEGGYAPGETGSSSAAYQEMMRGPGMSGGSGSRSSKPPRGGRQPNSGS